MTDIDTAEAPAAPAPRYIPFLADRLTKGMTIVVPAGTDGERRIKVESAERGTALFHGAPHDVRYLVGVDPDTGHKAFLAVSVHNFVTAQR
jgi:hypothetical protein